MYYLTYFLMFLLLIILDTWFSQNNCINIRMQIALGKFLLRENFREKYPVKALTC